MFAVKALADGCRIRVLDDHVIAQIAAGEVVERPSSVVKELLENALDAGAKRIDVSIVEGGREEIRVVDDGHGMSLAEVQLCLSRHATSKLRSSTDLATVRTLGFRGEGLSSVASVSRLSLATSRQGDDEGIALLAEGGRVLQIAPTGCRVGTAVCVRDLFFNTPARSKFLKSTATEAGHVTDTVNRLALAFNQVTFSLHQGRRPVVELPAREDREHRAVDVLGQSLHGARREAGDWLAVEAYLAPWTQTAATARSLVLIVNQRAVRDRMLLQAVLSACEQRIIAGRYPIGALYLDLAAGTLDANVHPQKLEVRFADPRAVHRLVRETVSELASRTTVPATEPARVYRLRAETEVSVARESRASNERLEQARRRFWSPSPAASGSDTDDYGLAAALERHDRSRQLPEGWDTPPLSEPRLAGLLFDRIVVCEWGTQVLLFDQKEGWRRIVALDLARSLEAGGPPQSELPQPVQLSLSARQPDVVARSVESLRQIGFSVEAFGRQSWIVRAVPTVLAAAWEPDPRRSAETTGFEHVVRQLVLDLIETARLDRGGDSDCSGDRWAAAIDSLAECVARRRIVTTRVEQLMRALRDRGDPSCLGAASTRLDGGRREGPGVLGLTRAELLRHLAPGK